MAFEYKVKNHVTVPQLKLVVNTPVFVQFDSKIVKAEDTAKKKVSDDGKTPMEPPWVAQVIDLEDGAVKSMVVNAVAHAELTKKYKDDSYVGKQFRIMIFTLEGKRYKGVEVTEIEVTMPKSPAPTPAKK